MRLRNLSYPVSLVLRSDWLVGDVSQGTRRRFGMTIRAGSGSSCRCASTTGGWSGDASSRITFSSNPGLPFNPRKKGTITSSINSSPAPKYNAFLIPFQARFFHPPPFFPLGSEESRFVRNVKDRKLESLTGKSSFSSCSIYVVQDKSFLFLSLVWVPPYKWRISRNVTHRSMISIFNMDSSPSCSHLTPRDLISGEKYRISLVAKVLCLVVEERCRVSDNLLCKAGMIMRVGGIMSVAECETVIKNELMSSFFAFVKKCLARICNFLHLGWTSLFSLVSVRSITVTGRRGVNKWTNGAKHAVEIHENGYKSRLSTFLDFSKKKDHSHYGILQMLCAFQTIWVRRN